MHRAHTGTLSEEAERQNLVRRVETCGDRFGHILLDLDVIACMLAMLDHNVKYLKFKSSVFLPV